MRITKVFGEEEPTLTLEPISKAIRDKTLALDLVLEEKTRKGSLMKR